MQPVADELHGAEHPTTTPAEETHENWVSEVKDEVISHIPFSQHDAAPVDEAHENIHELSTSAEEKPEGWLTEIKDEVASHIPFVHHDAAHADEAHENIQEVSNTAEEKPEGWLDEIKDEVASYIPFVHHNADPVEGAHVSEANNAVEEKHEGWAAEIKDEIIKDVPYAEPITNYAFGMGHRMPPDQEVKTATPAETPAEAAIVPETVSTVHEEAAPVAAVVSAYTEAPVESTVAEAPIQEHKHEETEPVSHFTPENHIAEPVQEHKHEEAVYEPVAHQPEAKTETTSHNIEEETFDEFNGNIDVEPDIISNIAATDYFMFDRAFGIHKAEEPVAEPTQPAVTKHGAVNEQAADAEQQDVSKYNDEKLPYSFLWWLDKTRKEHSGIYQPYIVPEKENPVRAKLKPGTDELQQQYYENIFHITSVEELDKSVPAPLFTADGFEPKNAKEHTIIERFIQEEPQIRPQSSDKLDNENKAKKSSEDRDELVSETLAAIYSDQMLYHKAIASYKKLMLKFPEKSRYFAAKIEQLEKKTN